MCHTYGGKFTTGYALCVKSQTFFVRLFICYRSVEISVLRATVNCFCSYVVSDEFVIED